MLDYLVCKSEEIQVPCQPSGRPSVHCSIRLDNALLPYGRQTDQHHPPGRRARSVWTPTLYREASVPACIRPDVSAARLDASQFLNGSLINQLSGRCGIMFGRVSL
jgi:hypothetical protein